MIGARQTKNILDKTLQSNNGLVDLTANFVASQNYYTESNVPSNGSINLIGSITANNATSITWSLFEVGNATALQTGSSTSINYLLSTSPTISKSYNLVINYTLGSLSKSKTITTQILVTKAAYVAQLPYAVTGGLTNSEFNTILTNPLYSSLFQPRNQEYISNFFTITAAVSSANLIFSIPFSFGPVVNIMDENDSDVLNEFLVDTASGVNRIYTMINPVVPGSYKYKIQF
jgi:hypothetical protein